MTDWTDADAFAAALERAETREKGNCFEDFAEGETVEHDPGLRLSRHGSELWAGQTLNYDPTYWRPSVARTRGYDEVPVHPDYLLACVMGASVEDLSEKGGYFLGREDLRYHRPGVPPGTELRVESVVEEKAESSSHPAYGIVTWETTGYDAATGDRLLSYSRTNMIPRREPLATDGEGQGAGESAEAQRNDADLPAELLAPEGGYFEDFRDALDRADGRDAAVAYRHERGRTIDDTTVAQLPLATLNTAKQHHNADAMADSPSGEIVAYGDVTRSIALGHARSDERTLREVSCDDERFHDFVTVGDTVYGFTRVLDATETDRGAALADGPEGGPDAGEVTFEHVAFNQRDEPVYSGTRTALVRRRD
ncbi:2-methylfumaryl-CoA hydratase [Halorussus sp. MSC15.2]|uniref:2-methylfumaryl-CoA hydratase n=1 Tax=Halorussus sp. MSC15.2 TaxID=2283638 RepID=UPI0013CFE58C|nr:2-methylfumaryl-CoA hydratase [Halorussus sp. MSC15.2]NEU56446.1 acyl dehydratase [Halorussus sp. MSC15.2]